MRGNLAGLDVWPEEDLSERVAALAETALKAAHDVSTWAGKKPTIGRVWLFGSRMTGKRRYSESGPPSPDSDLNIAIEIDVNFLQEDYPDEEDDYNRHWAFSDEHEGPWKAELANISPWPVDFQWYDLGMEHLTLYIKQSGLLIYDSSRREADILVLNTAP